jgi:periplasmic copper chaperone A
MFRNALLTAAALVLCAGPLAAAEVKLKHLVIGHPFARATPPGASVAGAFMRVENTGKEADRLLRAASPVASTVEIHEMAMEGGVMKMRAVPGIDVKPGALVILKPGGYHVMLIGLKKPLVKGETFPLTLTFEKSGSVDVAVAVEAMGAAGHTQH